MSDIKIPWPDWYEVRRIGNGSYGSVYEIEREDRFGHKESAALKVISIPKEENELEYLMDSGYDEGSLTVEYEQRLERIVNEYVLMAQLKGHPNILSVDDRKAVQQENGIGWDVYIRMELLTPLVKAIRNKTIEENEIKKIGISICRALMSCHEINIIHRDVKPANIFVSKFGEYKLGDFGVAKVMSHTTSATMTGTPDYMAPEVYKNEKYGREADIYSLGLVLYWLLNNRRMPFEPSKSPKPPTMMEREEAYKKRMAGTDELPLPANGSPDLKKIVIKALSYKPEDRYRSAEEMLNDLEKVGTNAVLMQQMEKRGSESAEQSEEFRCFPKPVKLLEKHADEIMSSKEQDRIADYDYDQTVGSEWQKSKEIRRDIQSDRPIPEVTKTTPEADDLNRTIGQGWYSKKKSAWTSETESHSSRTSVKNQSVIRTNMWKSVSGNIALSKAIVPLSAGFYHTLGLKADGTVAKTGVNIYPQYNIDNWNDIIAVSAGLYHSAGLKSDGTVIATGLNRSGQCNVSDWNDIVSVYCTDNATFGLKANGTVICTSEIFNHVSDWTGITQLAVNNDHIIGLRMDGTAVASGNNEYGQCDVSAWTNIIGIAVGAHHTIGLKKDGTAIATGRDDSGQCSEVRKWKNLTAVSASLNYSAGLKADGTVSVTRNDFKDTCADWAAVTVISAGENCLAGLKADGSVDAAGNNDSGQCSVFDLKLMKI